MFVHMLVTSIAMEENTGHHAEFCPSTSTKKVSNYGHSIQHKHGHYICDKIIAGGMLLVLQQPKLPESEEENYIPALVNSSKGESFLFKYASTKYCRHLR